MSVRRASPAPRPDGAPADASRPDGAPADAVAAGTAVPDLIGRNVVLVDKLAGDAGVVAVLSFRPRARQAPGTVVAVHPAAGSSVRRGSLIQVSVAGRPATDLDAGRPGVVACRPTVAELESVRAGASATLLRAAGYTVRVDPAAGAVRVEGDVPAEVAAALTERYGRAVVVVRGGSARRSA